MAVTVEVVTPMVAPPAPLVFVMVMVWAALVALLVWKPNANEFGVTVLVGAVGAAPFNVTVGEAVTPAMARWRVAVLAPPAGKVLGA